VLVDIIAYWNKLVESVYGLVNAIFTNNCSSVLVPLLVFVLLLCVIT
jgi:hypothetical protein